MEIGGSFICAYCLQVNDITVDSEGGTHQEYIEDCQVCCRPNSLVINIDMEAQTAEVAAEVA